MQPIADHPDSPPTLTFEQQARHAIEPLRVAIADVVAGCPKSVQRPADLTRVLGIDKSLASKLMRSIEADDPFAAAQLLPGPSGISIFLDAAARHGTAEALIDRASLLLNQYETFIREHARDRRTLLRMLDSLVPDDGAGASTIAAAHRKAAFEANSFIWGVKVKTHLSVVIVHPNADGETVDIAMIVAFLDLVRLRPDTPWVISRTAYVSDKGVIEPAIAREAIDPAAAEHEVSLMPEFCSRPLPDVTRRPVPGNFLETRLMSGPIGETAATTITSGEVYRAVAPRYRQRDGEDAKFYMRLRTPAAHMVNITLVQRGEFADTPPTFGIYSELDSVLHHPVDLSMLKPLANDTSIQNLGRADGPIVWPREAPRVGELIRRTCEHLNWPLDGFDVYQARQQYPILRSVGIAAFPMRPKA